MNTNTKSVELSTGVTLQYVEKGDSSGVPVVLIHGLGDSWHSYALVMPYLPVSIHAFALTLRGHGDSDHPKSGYQLKELADDVRAFLDALDIKKAVIVGHSMGSAVAQRFVINFPDRSLGLVVVSAFFSQSNSPVLKDLWESVVSRMEDPVDPLFVREFQESTIARPVPQSFLKNLIDESMKVPAHVWRAVVKNALEDDFSKNLHSIKVPVLIIWGDQDCITTRRDQDAQMAAIVNTQFVEYPDTGHAPHWEEPNRFVSDLVTFVETDINYKAERNPQSSVPVG